MCLQLTKWGGDGIGGVHKLNIPCLEVFTQERSNIVFFLIETIAEVISALATLNNASCPIG